GLPGGSSGEVPGRGEPGRPPAGSPPACRELLALRDETQKHAQAIRPALQTANEHRASPQEACQLFWNFLAAETKLLNGLEEHGGTCGAPPELLKQMRNGHVSASRLATRLCAGQRLFDRPAGPSPGEIWPTGDFWRPGELERLKGFPEPR